MDMSGSQRIEAPREKVWEGLNNPEILKQCIDGCEELNREGENGFSAKVTVKVGPVKAKFGGKVTLDNIDAPNGYTIRGEGAGGVAGFAKGSADVKLTEDGSDTVLNYTARAEVGGNADQPGVGDGPADLADGLLDPRRSPAVDDDLGPLAGQFEGDRPADPDRRAGDEGELVSELQIQWKHSPDRFPLPEF